jgi:6-phosphogluconolactonase
MFSLSSAISVDTSSVLFHCIMSWSESVLVGSFCAPIKKFLVNESGIFQYQGEINSSGPPPSYIIQSPCKQFIYCTVETEVADTSQVKSFRCVDMSLLEFDFLSSQPAGGGAPCFLSVDANNTYLFVSNYFGGNVTVFPINRDTGVLSAMCQDISFHAPLAPHLPFNRGSAHTHQTVQLTHSPHILLCELGQNAVYTFDYSPQPGVSGHHEVLKQTNCWVAPVASGPRHLVIHPTERYVYVLSELACTVMALSMDPSTGVITSHSGLMQEETAHEPLRCYSTLREDERYLPPETMNAAEILLSSDARFLYISNRDVAVDGRDKIQDKFKHATRCSIAVFAVLEEGASLQCIQHVSSLGCHPRALTLLHGGSRLAVANKDEGFRSMCVGGNLVVFPVDQETGLLQAEEAVVSEDLQVVLTEPTWIHRLI